MDNDEKRGTYAREPEKCPICKKVCKGKASLAKHISAKHSDAEQRALTKLSTAVTENTTLLSMVEQVADSLRDGSASRIPRAFLEEIRKQEARVRLLNHLMGFGFITSAMQTRARLFTVERAIDNEFTDESLKGQTAEVLLKMKDHLRAQLAGDLEYLQHLTGSSGQDVLLIAKLIEGLVGVKEQLEGMPSGSAMIPDDPSDRERLRRDITLRFPDAVKRIS